MLLTIQSGTTFLPQHIQPNPVKSTPLFYKPRSLSKKAGPFLFTVVKPRRVSRLPYEMTRRIIIHTCGHRSHGLRWPSDAQRGNLLAAPPTGGAVRPP